MCKSRTKYKTFNVPLVAITKNNSKIVENELANDPVYNGVKYGSYEPKGRFIGSILYWKGEIKEVERHNEKYRPFIIDLARAVDSSNRTYVFAAVKNKIPPVIEAIINNYKSLNELKCALSMDPFTNTPSRTVNTDHILYKIVSVKNSNLQYYLSFATKFCQFASKILGTGYEYSKYDSIVSRALPVYIKKYLKEECKKNQFSANGKKLQKKIEIYAEYCDYIDKIIAVACPGMTREQFDHIVWYTNK